MMTASDPTASFWLHPNSKIAPFVVEEIEDRTTIAERLPRFFCKSWDEDHPSSANATSSRSISPFNRSD